MFTTAEIAKELDGEVIGDGSLKLTGFAPATAAKPGDLTFAENETFFQKAEQSAAAAILIDGPFTSTRKALIRVANARIAFARVLPLFFPERTFAPGVDPASVVAPSAQIDPTAHIGPHCVIGEKVNIGPGVVLQGGNHIGNHCVIGAHSRLFPNVVLYDQTQIGQRVRIHAGAVIGSDGFGYVFDAGHHRKGPQVGQVIVQVGVAGSTKIGQYTTLAGQVGVTGHLKIGNKVTIAAQSGVMHDVPDGSKWLDSPAQPDRQAKRQMIALQYLPELLRRVSELEKQVGNKPPSKTDG